MPYCVYMLRTSGNTLYTGQTNNLPRRMSQHKAKTGRSAKYMRRFASFELVYTEKCETITEALKREHQIKKLSKKQKELLVSNQQNKTADLV